MTTTFKLNAYFDNEFLNFDYNEFESLSPTEQEIEAEMDELNLVDIVMLPYEHRDVISPSVANTPPCTPSTPIVEEETEEDDDLERLCTFIDTCLENVLRPTPTYPEKSSQ